MDPPLSALAHLQKIHILPTAASLKDVRSTALACALSLFVSRISSAAAFNRMQAKPDSRTLFTDYLKPYFVGATRHMVLGQRRQSSLNQLLHHFA